jgi:Rieske 2Fe-2S family protein
VIAKVSPMKTTLPFRRTAESLAVGAKTLPQEYFISPDVFAKEQEQIFSRQWILVGHHSQIAKPGDYILAEIAGESVIIVRDKGGDIRGFYNVCRHRGSRLCQEKAGHVSAIQCPYHAWTYSLDGKLIGAPDMDAGFDKSDYSLAAVSVQSWEGFIFVNLTEAAMPLAKWFAPLDGKFSEWNLSTLRPAKRIDYDINANWKLVFQNYSECYHCSGVHPELTKLSPSDSAKNDLCEGPFLGGFMKVEKGHSLTKSGKACALPVGDRDSNRVFYYSIFPNMLLSLHPDYAMVHQLWPRSPDRTLISCDWFFNPDAFDRSDFNPDDVVEFWDMVNRQDWHVCELSQQGVSSHAYQPGPYSPRESIPAAWDEYYLSVMKV